MQIQLFRIRGFITTSQNKSFQRLKSFASYFQVTSNYYLKRNEKENRILENFKLSWPLKRVVYRLQYRLVLLSLKRRYEIVNVEWIRRWNNVGDEFHEKVDKILRKRLHAPWRSWH